MRKYLSLVTSILILGLMISPVYAGQMGETLNRKYVDDAVAHGGGTTIESLSDLTSAMGTTGTVDATTYLRGDNSFSVVEAGLWEVDGSDQTTPIDETKDVLIPQDLILDGSLVFSDGVIDFTGDMDLDGDLTSDTVFVDGEIVGGPSEYINGLNVGYISTTSVSISAGHLVVDGSYVKVSSSTHTIINFDDTGFTYLYISKSGTITDSITEPTEQDNGTWYSGSLRCIGALYCPTSATIVPFHQTRDIIYLGGRLTIALNMNPGYVWQTPNNAESSARTPVNVEGIVIEAYCYDAGSNCAFFATTYELTLLGLDLQYSRKVAVEAYNSLTSSQYISLGDSRNIRITGADDDQNNLSCHITGWKLKR